MSMYLLTPEEAAHEAFVKGDSSAYVKLAAENAKWKAIKEAENESV